MYFVSGQQCKVDPLLHSHGNSQHLYCWRLHLGQQYEGNTLLRLHDNSGYANAPQCYVIRTYIAYPVTLYIFVCHKLICSTDSSVNIVTALRVWQPWDLGLTSGRNKSFVASKSVETGSGRTWSPVLRFPGALCTGVKRSWRGAEHSRLWGAEVNKDVAVPQLFHIYYCHDDHTANSPYQFIVLLTSFFNHFLTSVTDSWFSPEQANRSSFTLSGVLQSVHGIVVCTDFLIWLQQTWQIWAVLWSQHVLERAKWK
jgi:hypothetical protein